MPIFEYNGKKFNVSDEHIDSFMTEYPGASTIMERDGKKYRVKSADYKTFLSEKPTDDKESEKSAELGVRSVEQETDTTKNTMRITTDVVDIPHVGNMSARSQLRNANQRLRDIDERLSERGRTLLEEREKNKPSGFSRFLKDMGEALTGDRMGGATGNTPEDDRIFQDDSEYQSLRLAKHQIEEQIQQLENYSEKDEKGERFLPDFFRNTWQKIADIDAWDFGKNALQDANTKLQIANKAKNGEELNEAESDALYEMYMQNEVMQQFGNLGTGAKWGDITGHSISFMKDFMLTGGFSSLSSKLATRIPANIATKAATKLGLDATKSLGMRLAKDGLFSTIRHGGKGAASKLLAEQGLLGTSKIMATRALGVTAEDLLVRAPLMVGTVQGQTTASEIIKTKLGPVVSDKETGELYFVNDNSWGEAAWEVTADKVIENFSEMWGAHLPGMSDITKTFGARNLTAALLRSTRSGAGTVLSKTSEYLGKLGVNGYFGEVAEEYYGQLWRTMFGLDSSKDSDGNNLLKSGEFHADIWGGMGMSLGLTGGVTMGVNYAGKGVGKAVDGVRYVHHKHQLDKADARASEVFTPEIWDNMRRLIDASDNVDMCDIASQVMSDSNLSEEQRSATMEYMERSMIMRGHNLGEFVKTKNGVTNPNEDAISEAYIDGYKITTQREMTDTKNLRDYRRKQLETMLPADVIADIDSDPVGALEKLSEDKDVNNAIRNYVIANKVYEGMLQRVRDGIDLQINRSNAIIRTRTNEMTGMLHGATMKQDDRPVYIIRGNVVQYPDGSGIDINSSDESIIILDAETGEREQVSPEAVLNIDEPLNAYEEMQNAAENIRQQYATEAADKIDGTVTFNGGEVYNVVRNEELGVGSEEAKESIPPYEPNYGVTLSDENGSLINGTITSNRNEDGKYEVYTEAPINGKKVNLFTRAELDDMLVEMSDEEGNPLFQRKVESEELGVRNEELGVESEELVSAKERIPKDERGNPIYEQADSDTAWDAIVEEAEGDEAMAQTVADDMVADKEAALKKLEKAKSKGGTTPAEKIAAEKERKATIEKAKEELAIWKKIAGTANRRKVEAEEERRRIADEAALLRKAEEEKLRAEREEAERIERETLNGVPDMVDDTPHDARARGYRRVSGHKVDRQEPIQAIQGKETSVKFGNDVIVPGRVAVIDVNQLQPSHIQGVRNPLHFIDEAQPKERNDEASILAAQKIAENIRPEEITSTVTAYTGAPTVNMRGEAIQGNNRSEALRLMWDNNNEQASNYKQYLHDHAEEFGLRAEDIDQMERPVLVNMVDVEDTEAINLGQYVAQDTESGGIERIKPKNALQKMGNEIRSFANILLKSTDEETSFAGLVDNNGIDVLKWMSQKKYITPTQYQSAFDNKGNLTAEAKNDLRAIMYQSIFKGGSTQLEEMFNALPAKAQKSILATAFRDYDSASAERMIEEIQNSIRAYYALSTDKAFITAKNFKEARLAVEGWKRQYQIDDVTGDGYLPGENFSNFALLLATMYKGESQSLIQGTFNKLYDLIQGTQEENLFEQPDNTPRTLAQAIKETLNINYNGQQRSNVLVGDSSASQRGQQGSTGDVATGEQIESGERTADSARSIDGNSGGVRSEGEDRASQSEEDATEIKPSSMSANEAIDFVADMELIADVAPEIELTIENWDALFGESGTINTPIGEVKMGENQFAKLMRQGRDGKLGMIKPTLENPHAIVEEASEAKEGDTTERASSYIFIRSFKKADGSRFYYFTSITVSKDGREVVVSSQEKSRNKILRLLQEGSVIWRTPKDATTSSAERQGLDYEQPNEAETAAKGSGITPQSTSSDSKDTTSLQNNKDLSEKVSEAEADVNTNPTEAQKEAGNYKKGHVQIGTFNITIEQPKGSVRSGVDKGGKKWEIEMQNTYGYIRGTEGVDGDHIDVFLSNDIDGWNGRQVYVIDQRNEDGTFDEHKVMLGFNDINEAETAYLSNYEEGWQGLGAITGVAIEDFEKWIASSHRKTKAFAEYKTVKTTEGQSANSEELGVRSEELKEESNPSGNAFATAETVAREAEVEQEIERVYLENMQDVKVEDLYVEDSQGDNVAIAKKAVDFYRANFKGLDRPTIDIIEREEDLYDYAFNISEDEEAAREFEEDVKNNENLGCYAPNIDRIIIFAWREGNPYLTTFHENVHRAVSRLGGTGKFSHLVSELKEFDPRLLKRINKHCEPEDIDDEILAYSLEAALAGNAIKELQDNLSAEVKAESDKILNYLGYDGRRNSEEDAERFVTADSSRAFERVRGWTRGAIERRRRAVLVGQTIDVGNSNEGTTRTPIRETNEAKRGRTGSENHELLQGVHGSTRKNGKRGTKQEIEQQADLFGGLFNNETTNEDGLQRTNAERTERLSADGNVDTGERSGTGNNQILQQDGGRVERSRKSGNARVGNEISQSDKRPDGRLSRITEPKNTHNNHSERGKDHAPTSVDARIEANIKAIELAKQLLENGEQASKEQMQILRKFSGWGGLGKAFSEGSYYAPNHISKRLHSLLGEKAYQEAVMSANSAYYTPAYVVDTLWDIAEKMGFEGGNILEGSAGIGNILGQMPTHISERSNIHAVEIDGTSGGILSLLYPDANVEIQGFEQTRIANGSIDLAITNVPFVTGLRVNDTTGDKDLSKKFHNIHDFCIAKNVRKLREGGLGIFITSNGTLDNSKKLRDWIVGEGGADFVGAFRMHNKTFGGTGVTSDIIVIRKRVNGQKSVNAIDVSTVTGERMAEYDTGETRKIKGKETPVIKQLSMDYNRYFIEHPENMAGEMHFAFEKGDTFRPTSKGLYPKQEKNQEQMLAEWIAGLKADSGYSNDSNYSDYSNDNVERKVGEMFVKDGKLYINSRASAQPLEVNTNKVKGHTKVECFEAYTAIKEALADVLSYQTGNESDEGLKPLLDKLNKVYDDFVATYGHFNKNTAIAFLRNDVDYANIFALEKYEETADEKGNRVQVFGKTDIFSKRVVEKEKEPTPTNVKDGIIASIFKYGRVDVPYIVDVLNKSNESNKADWTEDEMRSELIKSGYCFEDPITRQIEASYQYLSGNIREKLRQAEENNEDGAYDGNIKALQEVKPMDIPAHLIEFTLGSSWVEPKLYEDYVKERTEVGVQFTSVGGTWFMKEPYFTEYEKNRAMGVRSEILNRTILGHTLIEAAIQNKSITVSTTKKHYDGTTETITDKEATQACVSKIEEIRQDFKDWARAKMQSDPEMSSSMERIYNDTFNNFVPMSIPDEFVPKYFGGASHKFTMRPHQGKAIVRGTQQPLLLAHEVGTGKTFTLISTAMEMRRLGTARKPMIVVQNATVGQFVESAKELYPNAKILTLDEADRSAEGRKNFYAKIRYNDWDMIVVPQSTFEFIPDSEERQMAFVKDKIEEKLYILEKMKEEDPDSKSIITRQAEREIELLESELAELSDKASKKRTANDEKKRAVALQNAEVKAMEMLDRRTDDVENFDDMGIDALLIDEAHEYKHLGFATAMQRGVKGVDPSYSKKSQGVYLKTQAVLEKNNGRNVIFATGTPISNTAAEIWTFMRYLMPADTMKEYGIYYFDDFVRNFGNIQQMLEFSTSGKFKENNRFAGYVNLPELVRIWSSVSDTVLTKDAGEVKDKIPELEGGKAQDIYLPQTRALRGIMKFVKSELEQYEQMSGKEKKENSHIPLTMYGIAKAAAVDARLVQADAEDDPKSKTNEAVRQTLRSLEETAEYKGTVAIFADNYQNKQSGFNLYEDIRIKLIAEGVPANQIVVMKSGMSVKKKLEIFEKVNSGEVRVILGSTFTLGTGVNIQERLHTLIHLDAPNRPMDYTQRNGRILRQGNLHKAMGKPVRVLRFGVEDSLDVTAYQRLKTKGAIADSIMNGKQMMQNSMVNRVLEEEEDVFGDTVAQLSGSEYAMLKNNAEKNMRKYASRKKQWEADQTYIHNAKPRVKGFIKDAEKRIEDNSRYLEAVRSSFPTGEFKEIVIGKHRFNSVEAMDDYFKDYNKIALAVMNQMKNGEIAGDQKRELSIQIGDYTFDVTTTLTRQTISNGNTLFNDVERKMTYSCPELGIENVPVRQNLLRNAIEDITKNVITGKDFAERLDTAERKKKHYETELEQLLSREGKPFEYEQELAQAQTQFEEYAELMNKELEEKEAKYAEMDAEVESVNDIVNAEEDDMLYRDDEEEVPRLTKSRVEKIFGGIWIEDKAEFTKFASAVNNFAFEDNGEGIAYTDNFFYAYYRNIDGQVIPYASVYLNGIESQDVVNQINQEVQDGRKKEGVKEYINRATLRARSSQNKNHVDNGNNSGSSVRRRSDRLGSDIFRKGRYYDSPNLYVKTQQTDQSGIRNRDGEGAYSDRDVTMESDPISKVLGHPRYGEGKRMRDYASRQRKHMEERVRELAEKLHLDNVEIVGSEEFGIRSAELGVKARAKGFYSKSTGKITIVIPNHNSVSDAIQTLLHEAVAHYGLRQLFGEHFDTFLDNVYNNAEEDVRRRIAELAIGKYKFDFRKATEEYLASLAESTNFEEAGKSGWWRKIKDFFLKMLSQLGVRSAELGVELSDNELRYILWRSYENLAEPGRHRSILGEAADVAKQYELKVGNYAEPQGINDEAAEADNGYSSDSNYSAELEDINERFNAELQQQIDGTLPKGHIYQLGKPSVILQSAGLPNLPIELAASRLSDKSMQDNHPFDLSEIKGLVESVQNPLAVFRSATHIGSYVVLTEIQHKGKNYVVAIEANRKHGKIEVNSVRSVHYRNSNTHIANWIQEGLLEYADKKRMSEWFSKQQYNSADVRNLFRHSAKIVENFENPTISQGNNAESDEDNLYRDGDPEIHERALARDRYERRVKSGMFQTQEALQDSMLGLKEAMKAVLGEKTKIEDVEGYENAYLGENRLSSVNKAEADAFAQTLFKPLLDEVSKLAKNEKERAELTDYMMAKHGLERNVYMRNEAIKNGADVATVLLTDYAGLTALTGMTDVATAEAEAQQMVDDYEMSHSTTALWDKVNAVSKAILQKSYECGMMNKSTFDKISDMYDYYIPLRGFDEKTSVDAYAYLSRREGSFNAPIKKAEGRRSKADDPFANLQSMAESAIMQGNRNKLVKQRFFNFALNHPSDLVSISELWLEYNTVTDEWQPVFPDNIDSGDSAEDVERKMQAFESKMEGLSQQYPDRYKRGKDAANIPYRIVDSRDMHQHQVIVKRGGKDYVITINGNPRAAQALNGQTNPDNDMSGAMGAILRAGEKVNRQLSALYTTRNPDFIVSNFMRDILYTNTMSWVKESPNYALRFHRNCIQVNPITMKRLLAKYRKGTLDMNDKTESMFYQFMMNGGETGYANIRDIEQHKNDIRKELKRANGKLKIRRALSLLAERLDEWNRAVENCARFAAFMTSREMGRTIDRAVYDAKEISVNFNKKGSGAKFYDSTGQTKAGNASAFISGLGRSGYVFWNAAIQGTTNFGRQAKRHPAKAFTAAATMFLLGAIIAFLGGDDDEDEGKNSYYNLPEYVRRSNILFRAGDNWISIPLPIEYRAFYGMGELMVSIFNGKEHLTGGEIAEAIAGQVTQILPIDVLEGGGGVNAFVPSAAKPLWEAYVAEKSWTGMPLYKNTPWNIDNPEWTKAYKSANKHIVNLSAVLNEATGGDPHTKGGIDINPAKLEYMLSGYFGGIYGTIDKLSKTAETIAGEREYDPRSILLWNRLVKAGDERTEYRAINNEYFRLKKEVENTKRRLRAYEEDTDNGVFDYAEKIDFLYNSPEYARYEIFEDYRQEISDLYDEWEEEEMFGDKEEAKHIEAELNEVKKKMIKEMSY